VLADGVTRESQVPSGLPGGRAWRQGQRRAAKRV